MAALAVGFSAGNTMWTVIVRAIGVMIISWFVGQGIGAIAKHTIDLEFKNYTKAHPLPKLSPFDAVADDGTVTSERPDEESDVVNTSSPT